MNDDNNITQIAFRKVIQNKKLTDEEAVALENRFKVNSKWGKFGEHVEKHWKKWALTLIASAGAFHDAILSVIISAIGQ